jgi:hypothetical protein
MSGKGSKPRPIPNKEKFESNWDKIFKKPDNKGKPDGKDTKS